MSAKLTAKVEFEAYLWGASTGLPRKVIGSLREFVFAIEAEAVAAERARIAEAVRGLNSPWVPASDWDPGELVQRAPVLAIIEGETP